MTEVTDSVETVEELRVAVLGAGKMGGILLKAFLNNALVAPGRMVATVAHAERARALSESLGVRVGTDNLAAAREADVILLGVKPWQVLDVVSSIRPALTGKKMLVSFAASVKIEANRGCRGLRDGGDARPAEYAGGGECGDDGAVRWPVLPAGADCSGPADV